MTFNPVALLKCKKILYLLFQLAQKHYITLGTSFHKNFYHININKLQLKTANDTLVSRLKFAQPKVGGPFRFFNSQATD